MKLILLAVLVLLVGRGLAMAADQGAIRPDSKLIPSVTVVGFGRVAAKPDMAEITVGVATQDAEAREALKANSEAMDRLLKALAAHNIEEKDILTSGFNVSPQYQYDQNRPPRLVGYQVANTVHVKVRQLATLGQVLDDVVGRGANQVSGISFSVAEPNPLLDQAREQAVADARRKAELYARAAGVTLGNVLLIQEQTPHLPRPLEVAPMAGMAARAAAVPVATGEMDFSATITITYGLK